jgi:hypothetical protein
VPKAGDDVATVLAGRLPLSGDCCLPLHVGDFEVFPSDLTARLKQFFWGFKPSSLRLIFLREISSVIAA